MSMQSLNQLVARSIIDPTVVQLFSTGNIDELLSDLEFSPEMRLRLGELEAGSWSEFAIMAFRVVKASEEPARRIELPSPMEGLLPSENREGREHVA